MFLNINTLRSPVSNLVASPDDFQLNVVQPFRKFQTFGKVVPFLALAFLFATQAAAQTLTCPEDLTVQVGVGECGTTVDFDDLSFGSTVPLIDTTYIPFSGSYFDIGPHTITLVTVSTTGQIASCEFQLIVSEPGSGNVNCVAHANVSLQGTCERSLLPQDLLQSGAGLCGDAFELIRYDAFGNPLPPTIDAFDVGQTFEVIITHVGSSANCTTEVTVVGGTPPAITCPDDMLILCNEPTDSSHTGVPTITGCYQEVGLTYFDELEALICPDTFAFQITRNWVSNDPFGKKDTCQQFITAKRFKVADVVFPQNRDDLEMPALHCSDSVNWQGVSAPINAGQPTFNGYYAAASTHCKVAVSYVDLNTPVCGEAHNIRRAWKVVGLCIPPITRVDTQYIKVLDVEAPVFDLPDTVFLSLTTDCADSVFMPPATNIMECSNFSQVVETPWDTLDTNGGRVHFDTMPGTFVAKYIFTDDCDNVGQKEVAVVVKKEVNLICPENVTVSCSYYFDTLSVALLTGNDTILSQIGYPIFSENCPFEIQETDNFNVTSCGSGTVSRSMTAIGSEENYTCVQLVTVQHVSDFEVTFPPDIAICTSPNLANLPMPVLHNVDCEDVDVFSNDAIIPGSIGNCFTVKRTWTVTNDCNFNGEMGIPDPKVDSLRYADGGDGFIQYVQTIYVNNGAKPILPNGCEIPDIVLTGTTCTQTITIPTPSVNGCGNVTLTLGGTLGTTLGADVLAGLGDHTLLYTATDDCGNTTTCTTTFSVTDGKAPIAKCKPTLTVELFSNPPIVHLFASDFDNGSTDNCSNNLDFSFSTDPADIERTFTCDDLGANDLTLFVTDDASHQASCQTQVIIVPAPFGPDCEEDEPIILGNTQTEDDDGVNTVTVAVVSVGGSFSETTATDPNGDYQTGPIPAGGDYLVTPSKNTNFLNGVTTFDAVLLTKHIIGTQLLNSPYKIIAADVNRSGMVTTLDAVEMRKAILQLSTSFQNNTSWRFVDADYVFPNPANPFAAPIPQAILVNDVAGLVQGVDFIAIKVGDLNVSADPQL